MPIREATVKDAGGITRVHFASWKGAYKTLLPDDVFQRMDFEKRKATWERSISTSCWPVFVLETEGTIHGFCYVGVCRDEDKDSSETAEVYQIYLDPECWGKGNGRALWVCALEEIKRRHYKEVILWAFDGNDRAERFYSSAGFERDGKRMKHPRIDIDIVRYQQVVKQDTDE